MLLDNQGNSTVTNHDGFFRITDAKAGKDNVTVLCYGYADYAAPVTITEGKITDLGTIRIKSEGFDEFDDRTDLIIDEAMLEDEEGNSQTISTLLPEHRTMCSTTLPTTTSR